MPSTAEFAPMSGLWNGYQKAVPKGIEVGNHLFENERGVWLKLKKGNRFGLPFKKQLKIYATCLNYSDEPPEVQHKIVNLCYQCGGEHHEALFKAVTTDDRVLDVATEYYINESWLTKLIKKFYECW